jgi:predicted small lipoprotein YifL
LFIFTRCVKNDYIHDILEEKMKKVLLVLVAFMLIFAVAGCNNGSSGSLKPFAKFGPPEEEEAPPSWKVDEVIYDLATWIANDGSPLTGTLTVAGTPKPIEKSGEGTVLSIVDGKLSVSRGPDSWAGVDLSLEVIRKYIADYKFEISFTSDKEPNGKLGRAPDAPYSQDIPSTTTGTGPYVITGDIPADFANEKGHTQVRLTAGAVSTPFVVSAFSLTFKGKR